MTEDEMVGWWGLGISSWEGTLTWRMVCGQRSRMAGGREGELQGSLYPRPFLKCCAGSR